MEAREGHKRVNGLAWTPVEEIGGGGKGLSPKDVGKMGMKHKCAHRVVDGANSALSLAILLRCMSTRQTECGAVVGEESINLRVEELGAVVSLERTYSGAELRACIGNFFC